MNILAQDEQAGWELPVTKKNGKIVAVLENLDSKPSEFSTVPVFSARLLYEGSFRRNTHSIRHLFRDEQTGMVHRFSPKTVEALLKAVAAEEVKVDNGAYVGEFTFQLYSGWVFTTPLDRMDRARLGL